MKNLLLLGLLLILLIIYLFYIFRVGENFSQIGLEKQVSLYENLRSYIDGNADLYSSGNYNPGCRDIPYTISTNCFADRYNSCRRSDLNSSKNNICKEMALNRCVIPNRPIHVN
jgi:hypothetical protein